LTIIESITVVVLPVGIPVDQLPALNQSDETAPVQESAA